jgi:hypothetical protein
MPCPFYRANACSVFSCLLLWAFERWIFHTHVNASFALPSLCGFVAEIDMLSLRFVLLIGICVNPRKLSRSTFSLRLP